jgi:hypothetical protein
VVRVAAQDVHEAAVGQREHRRPGGRIGEHRRGELDERAGGDQRREPVAQVAGRMTLGVGHDAAQAARGQRGDHGVERAGERTRARLEQEPAAAGAERDGPQLRVAQPERSLLGHLAANRDPHGQPGVRQGRVQRRHAAGQLADPHVVVGADVRRRADDRDPVRLCLARHRQRLGDRRRTVVDARKDVAVDVDHACDGPPRSARATP